MSKGSIKWQCINNCGACCRLDPYQREEAIEALDDKQRKTYFEMVNLDGWCKHYDSGGRRCRIYDSRPEFCKVSSLKSLFHLSPSELDLFAIDCCRQQIRSVYGGRSTELRKFERNLRQPHKKNH
ncbi:MAG TPA: YkgJ family cysteine cluster protein [Prochlorococcus sp.]